MERMELEAKLRKERGKGPSRRLRQEGSIPAILYGMGKENLPLEIRARELEGIISKGGESLVFDLKVFRDGGEEKRPVIIRETQYHPVRGDILHIDLYEISLRKKLSTKVPLLVKGEAAGVKEGGILEHRLRELEVECLPTEIPKNIPVDVSSLGIGDSIHVRELMVKEGVKILTDGESVVLSVIPPTVEEVAEVEEVKEEVEVKEEEAKEEVKEEEAKKEGEVKKGREAKKKGEPKG